MNAEEWKEIKADMAKRSIVVDMARHFKGRERHCLDCAKGGAPASRFSLGLHYDMSGNFFSNQRMYDRALTIYRGLAAENHVEGLNRLGLLYARGEGVPRNQRVALGFFRRAARLGFSWSLGALGHVYSRGNGVRRDFRKAKAYLRLAEARREEEDKATCFGAFRLRTIKGMLRLPAGRGEE